MRTREFVQYTSTEYALIREINKSGKECSWGTFYSYRSTCNSRVEHAYMGKAPVGETHDIDANRSGTYSRQTNVNATSVVCTAPQR